MSPGQPDRSYLLAKLAGEGLADVSTTGQPTTVMPPPPGDPLCTEKIAVVAQWIEEAARVSLIDHEQWRVVDATEDPFPDRPANVTCPSTAGGREDLAGEPAFSVHTSECDYLTVSQPALVDLRAGDVVQLRIWQAELTAPETSEAHLAIAFGNEAIWEERVPIPSSARLISASFAVEEDRDGATPVYWHVHNHGDNEYALIELSVGPPQ